MFLVSYDHYLCHCLIKLITHAERSAIINAPSSKIVTSGNSAAFQCDARGSNVSVRWIFNGLTCDSNNCEHDGLSMSSSQSTISEEYFLIHSTLVVMTDRLFLDILMSTTYTVQCTCVVEQNLHLSSLIGDNNIVVGFNLTVIFLESNVTLGKYLILSTDYVVTVILGIVT